MKEEFEKEAKSKEEIYAETVKRLLQTTQLKENGSVKTEHITNEFLLNCVNCANDNSKECFKMRGNQYQDEEFPLVNNEECRYFGSVPVRYTFSCNAKCPGGCEMKATHGNSGRYAFCTTDPTVSLFISFFNRLHSANIGD